MALSYKKNSSDFMDVVMRELEVCWLLELLFPFLCSFLSRCCTSQVISSMQNFDLEGKEESADEEDDDNDDEEEEEEEGKADWRSPCAVGAEWFVSALKCRPNRQLFTDCPDKFASRS